MIDLYFWPTPNGYKAAIMLAELDLEYRVIPVDITAGKQFEPEFLKINPNNKVPAIVDHDGPQTIRYAKVACVSEYHDGPNAGPSTSFHGVCD
jgi:GSH-dependent disulfide-bond oxidoreductase